MNSNMVKPEQFGHLPLVYHFTIPLMFKYNLSYTMNIKLRWTDSFAFNIFCLAMLYLFIGLIVSSVNDSQFKIRT